MLLDVRVDGERLVATDGEDLVFQFGTGPLLWKNSRSAGPSGRSKKPWWDRSVPTNDSPVLIAQLVICVKKIEAKTRPSKNVRSRVPVVSFAAPGVTAPFLTLPIGAFCQLSPPQF